MLEDSPDDVGLIERVLRKEEMNFVTHRVDSRHQFSNAIKTFDPDIVLSDHGLPQFNSIDALKICSKEIASVPFILVTGTVTDEFAVTCLKQGADDYVLKSNLSRLPSAIQRAIKERKLATLKKQAKKALKKQNIELKKVNKELDSFVYSVSHNLRGPLASVLGLLNIIPYDDVEKSKAFHEMMRSSILRLDQTLTEILDYSKNVHLENKNDFINFNELIDTITANLEYLRKDLPIAWDTLIEDDEPFICDRNRLSVILSNILSNAIKYRQKDDHRISIRISVSAQNALIVIRDNGIGINKNVFPRIFDMFYRGTSLSNGAGLGLYITREVLKKLEGTIEVNSIESAGTTVSISIPNRRNLAA